MEIKYGKIRRVMWGLYAVADPEGASQAQAPIDQIFWIVD
jgi:hypothetical protein